MFLRRFAVVRPRVFLGDSSLDYSRAFSGDVCEVLDLVWCLSQTLFMIGSSQPWLCMVKIGGAVIEHYVQLLFHC